MATNLNDNGVHVQSNFEEIKKAIRQLHLKQKIKAVALNHHLQKKKDLDSQLEHEIQTLQRKYDKLAAPLYLSSNEIIEGLRLPNEEELSELGQFQNDDEINLKNEDLLCEPIDGYWFKALKNSDIIAQEIKEKDQQILKNLIKIEYIPIELTENFTLQFQFQPNDFLSNPILKKTFILKDGLNPVKSEGTIIEWKAGKDVTKKIVKKKQKKSQNGPQGMVSQEIVAESFFNFFRSINLEEKDLIEKQDQENMEKVAERMDTDYDLARMIIDEIIPYSLEYYLGVKINDDYDDIEDLDAASSEDSTEGKDYNEKKKAKSRLDKFETK